MAGILDYHKKEHDARYLKSEKWKCSISPTGAHFWIVTSRIKHCMLISEHVCKACGASKTILKQVY
jgi:hypothetical protein